LFCVGKELASCLTPSPFQPVGEGWPFSPPPPHLSGAPEGGSHNQAPKCKIWDFHGGDYEESLPYRGGGVWVLQRPWELYRL
jgi:hypothetical protein